MFKNFTIILFALSVSSCASYYVVKSEFEQSDLSGAGPEVVEARSYKSRSQSIRSVAVKAPDSCIDETASQSSGLTSSAGTILKTSCGVEMALIERELARAGYQVVSWTVLNSAVSRGGITPLQAAGELNAHALIQINSLERSSSLVGNSASWNRKYFQSDVNGTVKSPKTLEENEANQLDAIASNWEDLLVQDDLERLSATINASITYVSTGQTIWFYEWTLAEANNAEIASSIHVRCKGEGCAAMPNEYERQTSEKRSTSSSTRVNSEQAADALNSRYHDLLKSLIVDMVDRFSA